MVCSWTGAPARGQVAKPKPPDRWAHDARRRSKHITIADLLTAGRMMRARALRCKATLAKLLSTPTAPGAPP